MPEKRTIRRARKAARAGKSPSTQAGAFVREEIEHIRKGLHGAANVKQAIAIGLSKARKVGISIPSKGKSAQLKRRAKAKAIGLKRESAAKRGRVARSVLKRKPRTAASKRALSLQGRRAARKAVRAKGPVVRRRAAVKAARTRRLQRRAGGR
jgi:hypothetical protein